MIVASVPGGNAYINIFMISKALSKQIFSFTFCADESFSVWCFFSPGSAIMSSTKKSLFRFPEIFMTPKKPITMPPIVAHLRLSLLFGTVFFYVLIKAKVRNSNNFFFKFDTYSGGFLGHILDKREESHFTTLPYLTIYGV